MLNQNIIPVSYKSPTGGSFITVLCLKARDNNFDEIEFSPHGNLHDNKYILQYTPQHAGPERKSSVTFRGPPGASDFLKIRNIFNLVNTSIAPAFIPTHVDSLQMLTGIFNKNIRICYDSTDINELMKIHLGKVAFDIFNCSEYISTIHAKTARKNLTNYLKQFEYQESTNNVLFLSWKNIFYDDPIFLLEKLSNFIGIPINQFDSNLVHNWRSLTNNCIKEVTPIFEKYNLIES